MSCHVTEHLLLHWTRLSGASAESTAFLFGCSQYSISDGLEYYGAMGAFVLMAKKASLLSVNMTAEFRAGTSSGSRAEAMAKVLSQYAIVYEPLTPNLVCNLLKRHEHRTQRLMRWSTGEREEGSVPYRAADVGLSGK